LHIQPGGDLGSNPNSACGLLSIYTAVTAAFNAKLSHIDGSAAGAVGHSLAALAPSWSNMSLRTIDWHALVLGECCWCLASVGSPYQYKLAGLSSLALVNAQGPPPGLFKMPWQAAPWPPGLLLPARMVNFLRTYMRGDARAVSTDAHAGDLLLSNASLG
jgi:hypothetical protein